ncbi:MAG TPA: hypothetical protein DHN33_06630 [Eubacteriaceae bacterium]|nr:hypothetical protein [Eubacteriaceae bacterium]
MDNNAVIKDFHTFEEPQKQKPGKRPPEIVFETKIPSGTKDGKTVSLINYKAFRIVIDNKEYKEKDFNKLFPNKYPSFNIRKTMSTSKNNQIEYTMYMYFPSDMLKNHKVKVICRKKMTEYTYLL